MSSPQDDASKDELAGTEQPFVSHLMELRDRLIRALLAVGLAFGVLCLYPAPAVCLICWRCRWCRICRKAAR